MAARGLSNAYNTAAFEGHLEVVKVILEHGTPVDAVTEPGSSTALMDAAMRNRTDVMALLLERGADPNYQDEDGCRPIDNTTGCAFKEAFEMLLPLTTKSYQKVAKRRFQETVDRLARRAERESRQSGT